MLLFLDEVWTPSIYFNYMFIDLFLCIIVVVVSLFVVCIFKSLFKNCVKPDYQYHQYTIFLSLQVLTVIT